MGIPSAEPHRLQFIGYRICPYAQRIRFCLEDNRVDYQLTLINPYETTPDWFSQLSPFGKVPLLTDNGLCLFESTTILDYINDLADEKFIPLESRERVKQQLLGHLADDYQLSLRKVFTSPGEEFASAIRLFHKKLHMLPEYLDQLEIDTDVQSLAQYYYGPLFNLMKVIEAYAAIDLFQGNSQLENWAERILLKQTFQITMDELYAAEIREFLLSFDSALSKLITA